MARAAVKAKQAARAKAQPVKPARGRRGHASGGNPNQQLFFMKLRRRQKWVFLALAVVFALTFVGVGVGSGSGGLSDLYSGLFGGKGTGSVSAAQAEIKTNPSKGYRDLANAYIQNNDLQSAALALQSYLKIDKNKKNGGIWSQLGGLEQQAGNTFASQYQAAQSAAAAANPGGSFTVSGALGTALGTSPVNDYYSKTSTSQGQTLYQEAISAYASALTSFQTAARLQPHSGNAQYLVYNAAIYAGKYPVALKALQRYVQLDPHAAQLSQIEKTCKQLGGSCTPKPAKKPTHK